MNKYMKKTAQRGTQQNNAASIQTKMTNGIPNSVLNDVFAGKRRADSSMMGHSQNLAPSIAAKMSRAFGMDLTGMQVYQSDAMKGTGMRGMAQGNKVVLSSEVNLNTTAGQAVLGHEISHIHAQSQGIGMGHSGLYENAALEHQADTEGLLAAQGRSIYSDGMDTGIGMQYGLGMRGVEGLTPLGSGMSASAGAPMQAWKISDLFKNKDEKAGSAKKPQNALQARAYAYEYAHDVLAKGFTDKYGTGSTRLDDPLKDTEEQKENYKNTSWKTMLDDIKKMRRRLTDFVDGMPVPGSVKEDIKKEMEAEKNDPNTPKKDRKSFSDRITDYYDDIIDPINMNEKKNTDYLNRYDFSVTNDKLNDAMKARAAVTGFVDSPFLAAKERVQTKVDEKCRIGRETGEFSGAEKVGFFKKLFKKKESQNLIDDVNINRYIQT